MAVQVFWISKYSKDNTGLLLSHRPGHRAGSFAYSEQLEVNDIDSLHTYTYTENIFSEK